MVTGCYDYVHSGHVRFFEEVSAYGDLYVILGHDANLRLLKGAGHPLFPQEERRYVVGAIRYVAQALIAVGDGLLAIGLDTPAIVLTSLGELGSMIDGFVTCTPGDAGPSMHSIIQTHFAHRPAFLRPFPAVSSGSPASFTSGQ